MRELGSPPGMVKPTAKPPAIEFDSSLTPAPGLKLLRQASLRPIRNAFLLS
jgi:hypothetical protein